MDDQNLLEKPLLILDLDEALVYTVEVDKAQPAGLTPDHVVGKCRHQVYVRPHLAEFLTTVWQHYNVAVWSSGGKDYVEQTIKLIMAAHPPPLFVWSSPRCTRRFNHDTQEEYFIKDLKKVRNKGYNPGRTLIVDDTPSKSERNSVMLSTSKNSMVRATMANCYIWQTISFQSLALPISALWKNVAGARIILIKRNWELRLSISFFPFFPFNIFLFRRYYPESYLSS